MGYLSFYGHISLQNLNDLEFIFQGHSRSNLMGQLTSHIYGFLLVPNSSHMIGYYICFLCLLFLSFIRQTVKKDPHPPYRRAPALSWGSDIITRIITAKTTATTTKSKICILPYLICLLVYQIYSPNNLF